MGTTPSKDKSSKANSSAASLVRQNSAVSNSTGSQSGNQLPRSSSMLMLPVPAPSAHVSRMFRRSSLASASSSNGVAAALEHGPSAAAAALLVSNQQAVSHKGSLRRATRLGGLLMPPRDADSLDEDGFLDSATRFEMTPTEAAFLPRDVRERLSQFVNGMLPPAPALFHKPGAAMFVDISGFSALGERLKHGATAKQAAEEFSRQVTCVLNDLTKICLAAGGDVAKYAGDALLCTFQGGEDEDECLQRAQNCAVEMLMSMRRYNYSTVGTPLQIHGGIAKGTILHFHLGSSDDELRWYLVAGDAVASAVALVDRAQPGQILLSARPGLLSPKYAKDAPIDARSAMGNLGLAKKRDSLNAIAESEEGAPMGITGLMPSVLPPPSPANADIKPPTPVHKKSLLSSSAPHLSFKTRKSHDAYQSSEQHANATSGGGGSDVITLAAPLVSYGSKTSITTEEGEAVELFTVTADTEKVELKPESNPGVATTAGAAQLPPITAITSSSSASLVFTSKGMPVKSSLKPTSLYDIPLHVSGTAYIPKALRAGLRTGFNTSEMRNKVSIVFVGLPSLALTDNELFSHSVPGHKLDALNQAFVKMTRVSHSFEGEIRDLLFDDKGCIFIAVFGAYTSSEMTELKACKCAMAISQEFPLSKVGVSSGTCFVGMCGSPKRHDFIVMGHEVNIAARCMVVAQEGQVLVSPEIERETRELIQYEKIPFNFSKHQPQQQQQSQEEDDNAGFVFKANSEIARRPSFLALYRYGLRDRDLFVGRQDELIRMEETIMRIVRGSGGGVPLTSENNGKKGSHHHHTLSSASGESNEQQQAGLSSSFQRRTSLIRKRSSVAADVEIHEGDSGVILLEAPAGMGKSAFVSRVKKFGKGRLVIASTAAFSLEQDNEFFVFRHLLESFTGFRRDMSIYQLRRLATKEFGEDDALDLNLISEVIPWMREVLRPKSGKQQDSASSSPNKRVPTLDLMEKIGKEVIKLLDGFRGETLNNILEGERTKGALLIIEDVQWMDLSSLRLLKYLLVNLAKLRGLVFFLTSRINAREEEEAKLAGAQSSERDKLLREVIELAKPPSKRAAPTEVLAGLTREDTFKLVALLLKVEESQVSPAVLEFVFDRTVGFPMYIISLMEWILERELLVLVNDVYDWADADMDKSKFPNTLADTMLAKFDSLDVQTRNLLKISTAIGNEFDAIKLTTLANLDLAKSNVGGTSSSASAVATLTEDKVLESLQKARAQGVLTMIKIKGVRPGAYIWRFKHEAMLLAVQSILPSERKEQLRQMLKPMRQVVENKKLLPLFAGFLGEVDDNSEEEG